MMTSIGAFLIIIGAALAAWQWEAVWMFIRAVVPLCLLAVGVVVFLIGYSQYKAKRFCKKQFKETSEEEPGA